MEATMQIKAIAQNKLLILYLLKTIGMQLSELQILRIVSENGWLNYFDLKECMFELIESRLIEQRETPGGVFYAITEQGCSTVFISKKSSLHLYARPSMNTAKRAEKSCALRRSLWQTTLKLTKANTRSCSKCWKTRCRSLNSA